MNTINFGAMSPGGFSICSWFMYNAATFMGRVFDFGNGAYNNNLVLLRWYTSDQLRFLYHCGSDQYGIDIPNSIVSGQWRHVCVVNQGLAWKIYDNGVLASSVTGACSLVNVDLASNYLGKSNWGLDELFIGNISQFQIYNKALSSSEVDTIYKFRGASSSVVSQYIHIFVS